MGLLFSYRIHLIINRFLTQQFRIAIIVRNLLLRRNLIQKLETLNDLFVFLKNQSKLLFSNGINIGIFIVCRFLRGILQAT